MFEHLLYNKFQVHQEKEGEDDITMEHQWRNVKRS